MSTNRFHYPQHIDTDKLLLEAQVKRPIEYFVTFMFSDNTTLTLPFETAEKVTETLTELQGKTGTVLLKSAEPVPSLINLDIFVLATPYKPE